MGYLHFKEERLTRLMFKLPTCPSTTHPLSTNNPPPAARWQQPGCAHLLASLQISPRCTQLGLRGLRPPALARGKPRPRSGKGPAQGHGAGRWQSWDWDTGLWPQDWSAACGPWGWCSQPGCFGDQLGCGQWSCWHHWGTSGFTPAW